MLEHTDKQYEKELAELKSAILKMGGMVEQMVGASMRSLIEKDTRIGEMAVEQEPHVNQLEMDIDARCLSILALRQPAAYDLRFILTNKYPPSKNMLTQRMPPNTLKERNLP